MLRTNMKTTEEEEVDDQFFKFGADLDDFIFNNQEELFIDEPLLMKNKEVQTLPCGIGISPVILCAFCFRFKEPRKMNKTNANSSCRYCYKRLGMFFSINALNHIHQCTEKPYIPGKSWAEIKCFCLQTRQETN